MKLINGERKVDYSSEPVVVIFNYIMSALSTADPEDPDPHPHEDPDNPPVEDEDAAFWEAVVIWIEENYDELAEFIEINADGEESLENVLSMISYDDYKGGSYHSVAEYLNDKIFGGNARV